jgi:hypothetical protein
MKPSTASGNCRIKENTKTLQKKTVLQERTISYTQTTLEDLNLPLTRTRTLTYKNRPHESTIQNYSTEG